ncbi:hypothetical protein [Bacillus cereus]|uniref:hypothetical protein n=1 Tax=Bacillus cereus TaxID=1396 RepID=UPI000BF29277|nr:hypothetical protein [Bacillus cereus]PER25067.1 hypothetical protein CN476_13580 [Bacillus cereus]
MGIFIRQSGPTCGIYALINGIYSINQVKDINQDKTDEIICEILKENFINKNVVDHEVGKILIVKKNEYL